MISIFMYIFAFLGILIIDEVFKIKEIHYLLLGIASACLLYGLSLNIDSVSFSLIFLYLSIIVFLFSIILTFFVYVVKIELIK